MQTQEWTCLLGQLVDVQALYELGEVRSHQYTVRGEAVEKRDGVPGVAPPDAHQLLDGRQDCPVVGVAAQHSITIDAPPAAVPEREGEWFFVLEHRLLVTFARSYS